MKISNRQFAEALYELTIGLVEKDLDTTLEAFVKFLSKNRRLKQGNNIIVEFEKIAKKKQGIIEIEITSARKLDKDIVEKIKESFAKQVEAVEKIDESLIGGVRVKLEDRILDASVRMQLINLKKSLTT
ncbi:MAG: ATP synthase F1 subunit delta [Candidatus Magasanikbacteria bacterium CG_4_10_14_0_8_um_filter_32_14]|uniref:ATP synthase subunit delta n=2 Tax=Candidatus Magasanikiibacteriota TaxID=1752731 RepID=A0A2M7RAP6_9BACT|nr:MAG: ATP synthase F1 subunit delta [Candidatus Magasanikbacteria bacterium CG1_02_32_51]PIY93416.1 MAG: ATP synthase F1 subunit delta [Candidatus Magasanikbacteria bacterium CG_4_10_14_0_8_um_filter_32_14]